MYEHKEVKLSQNMCGFKAPTRVRILQELIKAYPNRLTISKLQEITSEPRMTIWFHINKLRESNLVELDGSRRGFRAATRALTIRLNGNGIHLGERRSKMKEAMLYEQLPENKVKCNLCGRRCTIPEGSAGFCLVSKNEKGKLHSFVYACMQVSRYVGDLET